MGLTTWQKIPRWQNYKSDVSIAKNYLDQTEMTNLNNVVNIFLDIAEDNATRKIIMKMIDWVKEVESVLKLRHYDVLIGIGTIPAEQAKEKAETEYNKFKVVQDKKYISDFDKLVDETSLLGRKKTPKSIW